MSIEIHGNTLFAVAMDGDKLGIFESVIFHTASIADLFSRESSYWSFSFQIPKRFVQRMVDVGMDIQPHHSTELCAWCGGEHESYYTKDSMMLYMMDNPVPGVVVKEMGNTGNKESKREYIRSAMEAMS